MFVTTVVPWKNRCKSGNEIPTFSHTASIPSTTPLEGSSGVESTLPSVNPPVSSSKTSTSVKVPPTSTATLYGILLLSRKGFRHQVSGIRFLVDGDAVD